MAVFERRTVTTVRREWVLPKPCNAAEFGKAFASAHGEAMDEQERATGATSSLADDVLWVDATDEQIVIGFVASTTTKG